MEGMNVFKGNMVCQGCGTRVRDRYYELEGKYPLCMTCYLTYKNTKPTVENNSEASENPPEKSKTD